MTDLRDALEAAMDGQEPAATPEVAASPADPAQHAPSAPETPTEGAPAREANGRFAAKPAEAQSPPEPEAGSDAPAAPQAKPDASRPPHSASAPVKAAWSTLSPEVREDIHKRDRETEAAIRQRSERIAQLEPVDQALEPVKQRLSIAGVAPAQYVKQLVAADAELSHADKGRAQAALLYLARSYGIPLPNAPAQGAPPQPGQPPAQAQAHPEVQRLQQEVARLSQTQNEAKAQAEAARQAETVSLIQSFAADPKHPYFGNVEQKMGQLLASGVVTGATPQERLQNAYEAACWADPTVRPLMQPAGGQAQAANAGDKAARARAAGSSIAGAPTPGGSPGGAATAPSVRAALEGAWTT